jgi:hypothetical protein
MFILNRNYQFEESDSQSDQYRLTVTAGGLIMPRSKSVPFFLHVASDRRVRLAVGQISNDFPYQSVLLRAACPPSSWRGLYVYLAASSLLKLCRSSTPAHGEVSLYSNLNGGTSDLKSTGCYGYCSGEHLPHNLILQFKITTPF